LSPSFWLSHQYPIRIPFLPISCYMPCPSHPPSRHHSNYSWRCIQVDRLCVLVASLPGYRFRGPCWILGATRFWSGTGSTQPREYN
jgi:hypothetical protein